MPDSTLEKHQHPSFDALPRGGVGSTRRIVEAGMRGKASAAIFRRIVALEEQYFVPLHLREIVPAMIRAVLERVNLARAIAVLEISRNEVGKRHALRVADGQR